MDRPRGFQVFEAPRFQDNQHMKVVRLSALRTGRLYPQEIFLVLISVKRLSQPQGHSAAGRIMSMKNSNETIGNRTRDLPTCSAVPQPITLPRAHNRTTYRTKVTVQEMNRLMRTLKYSLQKVRKTDTCRSRHIFSENTHFRYKILVFSV